MRDVVCFLLTLVLFCSAVFAGGVPDLLPPGRTAAWWGLLFPGLLGAPADGGGVTFTWPLLRQVWGLFQANG